MGNAVVLDLRDTAQDFVPVKRRDMTSGFRGQRRIAILTLFLEPVNLGVLFPSVIVRVLVRVFVQFLVLFGHLRSARFHLLYKSSRRMVLLTLRLVDEGLFLC